MRWQPAPIFARFGRPSPSPAPAATAPPAGWSSCRDRGVEPEARRASARRPSPRGVSGSRSAASHHDPSDRPASRRWLASGSARPVRLAGPGSRHREWSVAALDVGHASADPLGCRRAPAVVVRAGRTAPRRRNVTGQAAPGMAKFRGETTVSPGCSDADSAEPAIRSRRCRSARDWPSPWTASPTAAIGVGREVVDDEVSPAVVGGTPTTLETVARPRVDVGDPGRGETAPRGRSSRRRRGARRWRASLGRAAPSAPGIGSVQTVRSRRSVAARGVVRATQDGPDDRPTITKCEDRAGAGPVSARHWGAGRSSTVDSC